MAIYHCSISHGARKDADSAVAKHQYVARLGKYSDRDDLAGVHSENLPSWAAGDADTFWQAVDDFSCGKARLFTEIECALPHELSSEEQKQLALSFAREISRKQGAGLIPFTLGFHRKPGNEHFHLLLSTRINDGIEREDGHAWFRKANTKSPEKGGARAWSRTTDKEWLERVRSLWAELTNGALENAGSAERVDHRSHEARKLDQVPTIHVGWRDGVRRNAAIEYNKQVAEANAEAEEAFRVLRALRAQDFVEQQEAAAIAARRQVMGAEDKKANAKRVETMRAEARRINGLNKEAEELLLLRTTSLRPLPGTEKLVEARPNLAPRFDAKKGRVGVMYIKQPVDELAFVDFGMRIKMQPTKRGDGESLRAALEIAASRWKVIEVSCSEQEREAWLDQAEALGIRDRIVFKAGGSHNDGGGHNTPMPPAKKQRQRTP